MTRLWDELEGVSLAGVYGLDHYLGSKEDAAYYRTVFGPEERPALLKLLPVPSSGGEYQLARWRRAASLSHPNLLAVLDCGTADLDEEPFLYAVFEYPDDSLATALANGPLSTEEVDQVMAAAEGAVHYLHENGMVHTAIDAEHIVAVGDLVKLTSDPLRNSGDDGFDEDNDERALVALREHLRTGVKPPMPLGPRVQISEPATRIRPEPAPPRVVEPAAARLEPAEPVRTVVTAAPALGGGLPKRSPALPLLIAAIGAVVIAVLLAVTQRSTPESSAWTPVASAAPVPAAPAAHAPVAIPAPPPAAPEPVAKPVSTTPTPERRAAGKTRDSWRVIVYTYNHRDHAEHKVQTLNRQKLGFHASIFAPRGADQAPFFVALGGRMSREEAVSVQRKAKSKGLPRDTFVRNFSE